MRIRLDDVSGAAIVVLSLAEMSQLAAALAPPDQVGRDDSLGKSSEYGLVSWGIQPLGSALSE